MPRGHADTFQIIDSVSQEARIVGFDRWATAFAEHDAKYMFSHVMELAEAQRLLQEYIDDPDVKVYIGQDLLGNSVPSLDIVVQREEYGENPRDFVSNRGQSTRKRHRNTNGI